MAITKAQVQITWPTAANTKSVSAGGDEDSEVYTPDVTAVELEFLCKADNNGTPASGDVVEFYLKRSDGDPDAEGDSADEYETDGLFLCRLDTNADDPKIKSVVVPSSFKNAKLRAVNNAASNAITCSAQVTEHRVA